MGIQPDGENIRKAVKWVSDKLKEDSRNKFSTLVEEACLKFNLSPSENEFLFRFLKDNGKDL